MQLWPFIGHSWCLLLHSFRYFWPLGRTFNIFLYMLTCTKKQQNQNHILPRPSTTVHCRILVDLSGLFYNIMLWFDDFFEIGQVIFNTKCVFSAELLRFYDFFLNLHCANKFQFCWKCAFYVTTWPMSKNSSNQSMIL